MAAHGVVSADSHVTEPADLWQERIDRRLRDRAPYVTKNPGAGPAWLFVAEGTAPFPVSGGFAAGRSGQALAEFQKAGYEAARPSGWDPVARIADQELDGIDAEVLYPSLAMKLFAIADGELQRACFAAYNAWLGEYCSHDPRRLYGAGLVSLEDVSQGVRDLEAIAKQGMRAAMIWGAPPEDRPYDDPAYDPFWRAAEALDLPVSLHIIAGRGRVSNAVSNAVQGKTHSGVWYMSVLHEIQDSLARIVFGGVLHRFPKLRIVSAENDVGWIPHFMYRMDHCHEKSTSGGPADSVARTRSGCSDSTPSAPS
jgi:predicted TIM-barrel fold metal-dependent hydrolase